MKLRTIGLVLGLCIGAAVSYARADNAVLIGQRDNETMRLLQEPCTNPGIVERLREGEAALKMELLSSFKRGEYLIDKEVAVAVCWRKSIDPEDRYIFIFEDGATGSAPQDEFQPEAI